MEIWHPCFTCKRKLLIELGRLDEQFKIASDWDLILRFYLENIDFHI